MTSDQKFHLITRNLEETITPEDLRSLLEQKEPLRHYIGFEISGKIHLGTGLMAMMKVRDFQKAGVRCRIFLADWHTWMNDKLGGDLQKIREVAVGYFKEGMKQSLEAVGGDPDNVEFVLGTNLYHHADEYWRTVIDVAKYTTLARMMRSITILGRKEGESVDFAKLMYPAMQVADIFYQGVNLAHAGMDQRKAHVIARDVAFQLKFSTLKNRKKKSVKPVAVHHHLLLGLQKPPKYPIVEGELKDLKIELKMSKSKPDSAIFIHDSSEEIERKVLKAFCPPSDVRFNPIIDWVEHLVLPLGSELRIKTQQGSIESFQKAEAVKDSYRKGDIHPMDVKETLIEALQRMLSPIRAHFLSGKPRTFLRTLEELQK